MRVIVLIGGMSWESSVEYCRILNEKVNRRLGGLHSAKCIMISVDFYEIELMQQRNSWDEAAQILCAAALNAERSGAECLLLCTNTMHLVAAQIEEAVSIPFFHIADATSDKIVEKGISRVGLLGTRYTMEQGFYADRMREIYNVEVLVPGEPDRQMVHDVIYDELCLGKIFKESRDRFLAVIEDLTDKGAEGIILGCTEIAMLIQADDTPVPVFDTTRIHAERAVEFALREIE